MEKGCVLNGVCLNGVCERCADTVAVSEERTDDRDETRTATASVDAIVDVELL